MSRARNGFIDYGRFIAALGIVWFHSGAPGGRLAYLALPFFLVLLATPGRSSFRERAGRLLRPFVIWSAIYALVETGMALHHGRPAFAWFTPSMLLAGTSPHLWFLPFALLVFPLNVLLVRPGPVLMAPVLSCVLLALIGPITTVPVAQWAFGIVPVLLGRAWYVAGVRAVLSLAACAAILLIWRPSPDNVIIIGGTLLALATLSVQRRPSPRSDLCASLSMWIYLGHMLVLIAGRTIELQGIALAVFGVLGSIMLAAAINAGRSRYVWAG